MGNRFIETTTLSKKQEVIKANRNVAANFIASLGIDAYDKSRPKGNFLWRQVQAQSVMEFIGAFDNHPNSFYTESEPVVEYIKQRTIDELREWDVVVISTKDGEVDGFCLECQFVVNIVLKIKIPSNAMII